MQDIWYFTLFFFRIFRFFRFDYLALALYDSLFLDRILFICYLRQFSHGIYQYSWTGSILIISSLSINIFSCLSVANRLIGYTFGLIRLNILDFLRLHWVQFVLISLEFEQLFALSHVAGVNIIGDSQAIHRSLAEGVADMI